MTILARGSHELSGEDQDVSEAIGDILSVDADGIETDIQRYIVVDDFFATNVPGIYALGGINGGPAHTHIAETESSPIRLCWSR